MRFDGRVRPFREAGRRTQNVARNLSRFREWAKRLAITIQPSSRIEITVQIDQVLIIRRRSGRVWCQRCGCEVDGVSLKEARSLIGRPQPALPGNSELEAWHFCAGPDGETVVCLESLLKTG